MSGRRPDVAGIWHALAQLPDATPEQRRTARRCRDATKAATSVRHRERLARVRARLADLEVAA